MLQFSSVACALGNPAFRWVAVILAGLVLSACEKPESTPATKPAASNAAPTGEEVTLVLNWVPEPEFGGFYEAERAGYFKEAGLNVTILKGGAGAPTWQSVASNKEKTVFGIASADDVVIARSKNEADIVALFAVYQNCPQAIMVHESSGFNELSDCFKSGTLAIEPGAHYSKYLKKKYGFEGVKIVPYSGGLANFLADETFSQQCFATAEPLAVKAKGVKAKTFLIAESGYNPYTAVVIAQGELLKSRPEVAARFVKAVRKGWEAYMKDPAPANKVMGELNTTMDAANFAASAEVQIPMIVTEESKKNGLGSMTAERWDTLIKQLMEVEAISKAPTAAECFREIK
jgi:NitT/TauT family transport system substrate-binding protein